MNTPKERLYSILKELEISANKFAEEIGMKRPQPLYDIDRGGIKSITAKLAKKIIDKYPQFDFIWLTTGEGEMLNTKSFQEKLREIKLNSSDEKTIPVMSEGGAMATPNVQGQSDLSFTPTEMRVVSRSMFEDAEAILPVFGNSMTPYYPPGSEVALALDESSFFTNGEVYAIEVKGSNLPLLKRIYEAEDNDYIILYSDNTMKHESGPREGKYFYPPQEIHKSEIMRKWAVIGDQKRRKNKPIYHR